MERVLTLEVPESIYSPLEKAAEKSGRTPEQLAVEWLGNVSRNVADDPLEKFIGAFKTNVPDWADEHDKYISAELLKQMTPNANKGF